jgi:hypothetical protein
MTLYVIGSFFPALAARDRVNLSHLSRLCLSSYVPCLRAGHNVRCPTTLTGLKKSNNGQLSTVLFHHHAVRSAHFTRSRWCDRVHSYERTLPYGMELIRFGKVTLRSTEISIK